MDHSSLAIPLWAAAAAALGGLVRYRCSGVVAHALGETFPWGTLVVNVVGSTSDRLLTQGARAFVNHPRGPRVDGRLTVSSICVWFQEDFGGDAAGVIAHLRRYAAPPLGRTFGAMDGSPTTATTGR